MTEQKSPDSAETGGKSNDRISGRTEVTAITACRFSLFLPAAVPGKIIGSKPVGYRLPKYFFF